MKPALRNPRREIDAELRNLRRREHHALSLGFGGSSDIGSSDIGSSDIGGSDIGGSDIGGSDIGGSDIGFDLRHDHRPSERRARRARHRPRLRRHATSPKQGSPRPHRALRLVRVHRSDEERAEPAGH